MGLKNEQNSAKKKPGWYQKMSGKTRAGLHVVHMKVSEKEPVPEFEAVAKCDQHNGEVSCTHPAESPVCACFPRA